MKYVAPNGVRRFETVARGPITRDCPKCGAQRGHRCVARRATNVAGQAEGEDGSYLATLKLFHAERRKRQ